jgi:site-specific recombinase XerD
VGDLNKLKAFEKYLLSNNKSKETIQSYIRTIKQFLDLVNKLPEQICKEDIEKYKYWAHEIKHYDRNSLTPKYCAIKSYLELLEIPDKELKSYKLSPPKIEVKPKTPLTRQEIQKLFEITKDNLLDHAILKTLYYSTIRRKELCNLNIQDIDFQRQKIRTISKGGHYDERNLHPDALKVIGDYLVLRNQPKDGHENALFLNTEGERIGKTYLSTMINKYTKEAGITKRVYPHLFRASSITHMHNAGASIPEIMAQSKHRSVDTLVKHYICPSEERFKEVYLNTLSFNTIFRDQKHSEPATQITNLRQQLIRKLANGEITNEAFLQAIRVLNPEGIEESKGYS